MQEIDIFVFMKYQQHADLLYLAITSIKICSSIVNFFYQYCDRQVQEIQAQNIQYTTSVSMIILSGRTYSSQNVRQIWESTLSKSDYLVGRRGRTWEWIFKDFFYISRGEHIKHFVIDAYL
jgi:hypothetical protein